MTRAGGLPAAPTQLQAGAKGRPRRRRPRDKGKPEVIAADRRGLLEFIYPGDDFLDVLLRVTDRDNTLAGIIWRLAVDGPAVLTKGEGELIGQLHDHAGQLKPWDVLLEHVVAACNDPAIQADDDVSKLAAVLFRLCDLASQAGTGRIIGRVVKLADAVRASGAPTRSTGDSTRETVAFLWQRYEREGRPIRSRVKSMLLDEPTLKESTVRDCLRQLGLYDPAQGKKRG